MFAIIAYIQNHIHDDLHKPIALHNVAFSPQTPESFFFFFIFINILFFYTPIFMQLCQVEPKVLTVTKAQRLFAAISAYKNRRRNVWLEGGYIRLTRSS